MVTDGRRGAADAFLRRGRRRHGIMPRTPAPAAAAPAAAPPPPRPGRGPCPNPPPPPRPARRGPRPPRRSRAMLAANFRRQNAAFPFGRVPCRGHPCQKQPSTNTASRAARNTKSGRTREVRRIAPRPPPFRPAERLGALALEPGASSARGTCLRHPVIPWARSRRASAPSVRAFPRDRMRAINWLRWAFVKTSGMARAARLPISLRPPPGRRGRSPACATSTASPPAARPVPAAREIPVGAGCQSADGPPRAGTRRE